MYFCNEKVIYKAFEHISKAIEYIYKVFEHVYKAFGYRFERISEDFCKE